jgi:hypothetical protein
MPESYERIESRIENAIVAILREENPNISRFAREFNVPYHRLRNRLKGRDSRSTRSPVGRLLSDAQESALCRYLNILDELDIHARPAMVETAANSILKEGHTHKNLPPPTIGMHWLKRFFQRHPEYRIRKRRAIDLDRKKAHEPATIQAWFEKLRATIDSYGIAEEDIYNFDETGFNIGIGRDQWIITREFSKPVWSGSNTNREYATVIEAVSATGSVIPPFIIFAAKCVLQGWFDNTEIGKWIGVTETGYVNDLISYQWVQHFHHATKYQVKGTHRLLICDGYGSHMTYEFVRFCEDHKIIVFFLIPHTSHILQPLDVGVFQAYKHWHSEAIADATQTGGGKFTKVEFLNALDIIRQKTFKKQTIRHGFRATGIVPYNPHMIIEQLEDYMATPPPPSSSGGSSHNSTPKTADRFKKMGRKLLYLEALSDEYIYTLAKLAKGSVAQAHLIEELRRDLAATTAAQQARKERTRASRRRIQTGGVVSSMELDRMARIEKKVDNLVALNQLRKKWRKVVNEFMEVALARGIILKKPKKL